MALWATGLWAPGLWANGLWATTAVAPTVTTTTLNALQVGVAFSQQLVATGDEPITWTGTVPDGLTLSSAGLLSGTPTTAYAYSSIVTATNDGGSDVQWYSGEVWSGLTRVPVAARLVAGSRPVVASRPLAPTRIWL